MKPWPAVFRDSLISGSIASLLSAAAMVGTGLMENGRPAAPLNAVSHWVWGRRVLHSNGVDLRHTLLGYGIHHASALFWAVIYERWLARRAERNPVAAVVCGSATAAAAALVDLRIVPERLTPGCEHELSRGSMFVVYASVALGLALPALLRAGRR